MHKSALDILLFGTHINSASQGAQNGINARILQTNAVKNTCQSVFSPKCFTQESTAFIHVPRACSVNIATSVRKNITHILKLNPETR